MLLLIWVQRNNWFWLVIFPQNISKLNNFVYQKFTLLYFITPILKIVTRSNLINLPHYNFPWITDHYTHAKNWLECWRVCFIEYLSLRTRECVQVNQADVCSISHRLQFYMSIVYLGVNARLPSCSTVWCILGWRLTWHIYHAKFVTVKRGKKTVRTLWNFIKWTKTFCIQVWSALLIAFNSFFWQVFRTPFDYQIPNYYKKNEHSSMIV